MREQVGAFTTSIVISTLNESSNIINLLKSIFANCCRFGIKQLEVILVDYDSTDRNANLVERFSKEEDMITMSNSIKTVRRQEKKGLSSAILDGFSLASSDIVLIMNADFSHPPELIPEMIRQLVQKKELDLVIASRYVEGGGIEGRGLKIRLISIVATKVAQYTLDIKKVKDPLSGFFAIRRIAIKDIKFDAIGCNNILLETLVKADLRTIIELPYIFRDSTEGSSKLGIQSIIQYLKICRKLYSHKQEQEKRDDASAIQQEQEGRGLYRLAKKAGQFYLVGASGLIVNYGSSLLIGNVLLNMYYLHATVLGISLSIVSNFLLNKLWTFHDRDFSLPKVARQAFWFLLSCIIGIAVQMGLIYSFVEITHLEYMFSLGLAVLLASISNFLTAKKLAFRERFLM
jgi:dolichol-phosphate mannosyltransferase